MNPRNDQRMNEIYEFIKEYIEDNGQSPTTDEICREFNVSKATVSKFVGRLVENGEIERAGRYGLTLVDGSGPKISIPLIGSVACGKPILAREDIEAYITVDRRLVGDGEFFALTARGNSMIEAGIQDGDIVYVRRQPFANEGDIVVAMITDEQTGDATATLKRLFFDRKNEGYILHPENISMRDITVSEIAILGVATKVLKSL